MSKYIIRNCPACRQYQVGIYTCDDLYDCDLQRCQDCTDCLLKRIVEKCKDELGCVRTIGKDIMAEEILKLIDIEEVE